MYRSFVVQGIIGVHMTGMAVHIGWRRYVYMRISECFECYHHLECPSLVFI